MFVCHYLAEAERVAMRLPSFVQVYIQELPNLVVKVLPEAESTSPVEETLNVWMRLPLMS